MMNYIKRAIIAIAGKDDTARPVQQIEYLGKLTDAEIIFPYGVHANLPKDSLMVVLPILNSNSNLVAFGGMPNKRIQVEAGEVVFFHPETKAKIHFKADGTIEIDALEKDITVNCNNMKITGNLEVAGDTALGATVTSNGKDISDTHQHDDTGTYTNSGGPVTGTSGVPT